MFRLSLDDQRLEVSDNLGQSGYTGHDEDPTAGEFAVSSLDFGTWALVETRAPAGYLLDEQSRQVDVRASAAAVDAGVFVNVAVRGPQPQAPALPATPSGSPSLAYTGVDGLPQLMGAAALLLVLGTGLWRVAGRREV